MASPKGSATVVHVLAQYLDLHGFDAAGLLAEFGWTPERVAKPLELLPLDRTLDFVARVKVVSGDPLFVTRAAAWAPIGSYHLIDYLHTCAETVGEGALSAFRLIHLIDEGLRIVIDVPDAPGAEVTLRLEARGGDAVSPAEAEGLLAAIASRAHHCTDGALRVARVCFRCPPFCDPDDYLDAIGCPVVFDADLDAVVYPRALWDAPSIHHDALLYNLTHQIAFKVATPSLDLVYRVEAAIERGLRLERPDLSFVATSLRMSSRTLQRKLSSSDLSFQHLVDRVRRRLARDLIANPDLNIGEIGALLGLKQPASFTRAFKRWFGASPRQFRRSLPDASEEE
jgi:AraC-like DNA-binding protein